MGFDSHVEHDSWTPTPDPSPQGGGERTAAGVKARFQRSQINQACFIRTQNDVPPPNLNSCTVSYLPLDSGTA